MDIRIFIVCLNAVLPTFLIMAVGFLARQIRLLNDGDVSTMNNLAFKLFLPVMLFQNIYSSDLASSVKPGLLLYAVVAVLAAYGLSIAYTLSRTRASKASIFRASTAPTSWSSACRLPRR